MKRAPKLAYAMRYHTDAELEEMAATIRDLGVIEDVFGPKVSLDGFRLDVWGSAIQYEVDRRRVQEWER